MQVLDFGDGHTARVARGPGREEQRGGRSTCTSDQGDGPRRLEKLVDVRRR